LQWELDEADKRRKRVQRRLYTDRAIARRLKAISGYERYSLTQAIAVRSMLQYLESVESDLGSDAVEVRKRLYDLLS
jgi:hypothetical protein